MAESPVQPAHAILESLGLKLSPEFIAALDCQTPEQILNGGVRGGKSTVTAAKFQTDPDYLVGHDANNKPYLGWIVGPTYQGAHKEMEYLVRWAYALNLIDQRPSLPDDGPQRLKLFNGSVIETRSSTNPERLASDAPHRIAVVEAGQQPETVLNAVRARALENSAPILLSGTLEDKQQYVWYEKLSEEWREYPTADHCTITLPTWSNLSEFPLGANDPKILAIKERVDEYTFSRTYAGIAGGAQNPAYPQLRFGNNRLLELPKGINWITSVGGADYGDVHPSALVVVSLSDQLIYGTGERTPIQSHIAWVRECWWDGDLKSNDLPGDVQAFNAAKRRLQSRYHAYAWATDPNERYMAGGWDAEAVRTGAGSRENRMNMVRSRLNAYTLYYDLNGPGVPALYEEQKRVRYTRMPDGQLKLLRVDDDRTAALENAIYRLDGQEVAQVKPSVSRAPRYTAVKPKPRIGAA